DGRKTSRVVRQRQASSERLGLGSEVSAGWSCGCRSKNRKGQVGSLRPGDNVSRPASRDIQVPVQWNLLRRREGRNTKIRIGVRSVVEQIIGFSKSVINAPESAHGSARRRPLHKGPR